jgi:hypothetical protein
MDPLETQFREAYFACLRNDHQVQVNHSCNLRSQFLCTYVKAHEQFIERQERRIHVSQLFE